MSTIDPAIAARERSAKRPGTVRVAVLLLLLLIGGFGAGFGWGAVGGFSEDVDPPVLVVVAIPVGMALTIVCSILWSATVMRRSDVGLSAGWTAALIGGGAGVLLASTTTGSSGADVVLVGVGIGLLVLGLASFVLGLAAAATRRRAADTHEEILRTGMLTTATVSDQGWVIFRESTRILTTVTFTFVDTSGVRRWVQKAMVIRAEDPLTNGQQSRLWYDPANPGDEKRIVVEAAMLSPLRPAR
ncbi:hypothetical protein ACEXQE_10600 [Herbiconiux sp. P17]|uniref:hypothetical protein n=1 Tax=Herbiconiux wuyangfengii TaxID=3342794 RepID=UPI0035BAC7D8